MGNSGQSNRAFRGIPPGIIPEFDFRESGTSLASPADHSFTRVQEGG
jgi:hypothetical protein